MNIDHVGVEENQIPVEDLNIPNEMIDNENIAHPTVVNDHDIHVDQDVDVLSYHSLSSSDTDHHLEDESLVDELRSWASQFNITHNALQSLLSILRPYHEFLPKDPRTLLKI